MFHVKHIEYSQSRASLGIIALYSNIFYKTLPLLKYVLYPPIHVFIHSFPPNMFYVEH